jgi:hypothetical protein
MAAINHGGTFYRLDKSSQSGDCGEANVMALHLASKQVMPFAFAVKGIPFGYSLTQVKAQSNCIRAGSFSPFPSCHASGTPGGSSTASTHNPYKEVILSRRPFNEGVKGCTRAPPTPLRTCSPSHDPALKNKRPSIGTRSEQSLFL